MPSRIRGLLEDLVAASDEGGTCADVRGILARPAALEAIAADCPAIGHVLGFTQVRLGEVAGRVVRLHVWSRTPDAVHDVHTHTWPLKSYVLAGTMENWLFDVEADAGERAGLYRVTYHAGGTRRVFTGVRVRAERSGVDRIARNGAYEIGPADFHDSNVVSEHAITLIVSGVSDGRSPLVVGPPVDPLWPEFPLVAVDGLRLRACLSLLHEELRN